MCISFYPFCALQEVQSGLISYFAFSYMNPKRICVYCASSKKVPQQYFEHTSLLAKQLVKAGHHIVYGGGAVGLMGTLADTLQKVVRLLVSCQNL